MNDKPTSPLRTAAIQTHEMYTELKAAGFSRSEAMELIARTLSMSLSEAFQAENEKKHNGD